MTTETSRMILNKRVSGPTCSPGSNCYITLKVKIPNKIGKYCMYYQLFSDNKPFGPKLYINITAINKNNNHKKSCDYDFENE